MEVDVILSHELVQTNVVWIEPPLFPLVGIVCGYTRVTNAGIKLNKPSSINLADGLDKATSTDPDICIVTNLAKSEL